MNENYAVLQAAASFVGGEVRTDAAGKADLFVVFEPDTQDKAPAFGGKNRLLMGKYECCERMGGLHSLPLEEPKTGLTFDAAAEAVLQKGLGYHLMTIAEWALLCERGSAEADGRTGQGTKAATGSGTWFYAHSAKWTGVWDAAGNVREWVSGYRTVDGEIQLIPENGAANAEPDELGSQSMLFKAISKSGTFVEPGTEGSLKWRYESGQTWLDVVTKKESASRTAKLEEVRVAEGIQQTALNLLETYGIAPGMKGTISYNTSGERLAAVGACYKDEHAGLRVLCGTYTRKSTPEEVGVRICYTD